MIQNLTSKPKVIIILIICVLFIAYSFMNSKQSPILPDNEFAFSPTPQDGQLGGIEGIYYHRESSFHDLLDELTCKADGWENCTTYNLIRFYRDGTVVETPIGTDDGFVDGVLPQLQWFNREAEEIGNGQYYISGNRVWFSTTVHYNDDYGTVTIDFSGFMVGNILILDRYSHSTGYKSSKTIFIRLKDNEKE